MDNGLNIGRYNDMEIKQDLNGTTLVLSLSGRLDAVTAGELEKVITGSLDGVTELIFDMKDLSYIASAGLRTLLVAQKRMKKQGDMRLRNVQEDVREVLDMTGFVDFLQIEE